MSQSLPELKQRFAMFSAIFMRIGMERLQHIAQELGITIKRKNPYMSDYSDAILEHLGDARSIRPYLNPQDLEKTYNLVLFYGTREKWQQKNPGKNFDDEAFEQLVKEEKIVVPTLRLKDEKAKDTSADWPQFTSLKKWQELSLQQKKESIAKVAKALGKGYVALDIKEGSELGRIKDKVSEIVYVIIPGGNFEMGMSDKVKISIQKIANKLGSEAKIHMKGLVKIATPAHQVILKPFLCSESALTQTQLKKIGVKKEYDITPFHDIGQLEASKTPDILEKVKGRLLSESEWEYIAKANANRLWLSGEKDPKDFIVEYNKGDLLDNEEVFGIHGLPWGTWVDDGWHGSYQNAPCDGSAWEPYELPQVVRGGGAPMLFPWQMGGEAMLLLTIHREKSEKGEYPLIVAKNLPPLL